MKMLKSQNFFNGSLEEELYLSVNLLVVCGENIRCQRVYLQHNSFQMWRIPLPTPDTRE